MRKIEMPFSDWTELYLKMLGLDVPAHVLEKSIVRLTDLGEGMICVEVVAPKED